MSGRCCFCCMTGAGELPAAFARVTVFDVVGETPQVAVRPDKRTDFDWPPVVLGRRADGHRAGTEVARPVGHEEHVMRRRHGPQRWLLDVVLPRELHARGYEQQREAQPGADDHSCELRIAADDRRRNPRVRLAGDARKSSNQMTGRAPSGARPQKDRHGVTSSLPRSTRNGSRWRRHRDMWRCGLRGRIAGRPIPCEPVRGCPVEPSPADRSLALLQGWRARRTFRATDGRHG